VNQYGHAKVMNHTRLRISEKVFNIRWQELFSFISYDDVFQCFGVTRLLSRSQHLESNALTMCRAEDGESTGLWNIGMYWQKCTVPKCSRITKSCSPSQKSQILHMAICSIIYLRNSMQYNKMWTQTHFKIISPIFNITSTCHKYTWTFLTSQLISE
jgi:hypothetical protein